MNERFERSELLLPDLEKIQNKTVAIFGLGGVGGYVVEGLARCGIKNFLLIDNDVVSLSNMNRQIIATTDTIGRKKTDVIKERILSIQPDAHIETYPVFYLRDKTSVDLHCDYVVDVLDTITAKMTIIEKCQEDHIPLISCMGTGNRLDLTQLTISTIEKTSIDPLAKVIRRECKKRHIRKVKVLYSKEYPVKINIGDKERRKATPGSVVFVPAVAGMMIARTVILDLLESIK